MIYRNNKNECEYRIITEGIDCNNNHVHDLTTIYTYNEGFLLGLRLFIIRLLMPDHIFVRNYAEFNEKFTPIEKK